jgi:hypothetical protein
MPASYYRRMATDCLQVAERMSLHRDRERLVEMARQWITLAQRAEAEGGPLTNKPASAEPSNRTPQLAAGDQDTLFCRLYEG